MLPRMNKNYKERNSFTMLSRFVLPLSVVMVLVLLFISVKLLFLYPDDINSGADSVYTETPVQSATIVTKPAAPVKEVKEKPVKIAEEKTAGSIVLASPVEISAQDTNAPQHKTEVKKQKPVLEKKTVAAKKKQPEKKPVKSVAKQEPKAEKKTAHTASPAGNAERWDVQVGGFSSKESAEGIKKKVQADGYSAYITEGRLNSKPFYRIRVKGSADKGEAQQLAKRLEQKGYPVYVVNTSK